METESALKLRQPTRAAIDRCLKFQGGRSRPDKSFPFVLQYLYWLKENRSAQTILDIGCGRGSAGIILEAEFGDYWTIDGIEVEPRYLESFPTKQYRQVHVGNYLSRFRELRDYDVWLFVDVLEHFEREFAINVCRYLRSLIDIRGRGSIVASIPNAEKHWHQSEAFEKANPFEAHRYDWTDEEIAKDLGLRKIGDCDGLGVYVF